MTEWTVKCSICGAPYKVYLFSAADQSACPDCIRKAEGKGVDKLKTLDEFNKERQQLHRKTESYPKRNGIECPKCGEELMDADDTILLSNPPQRNVVCSSCDFRGYRIV